LTGGSFDAAPTAAVLIIGNEILSGRTQDTNLNAIALKLTERGVRLREARVVADVEAEIVDAVRALSGRYDYVFTTGGIGPTHDDITAEAIAKAFGVPLIQHPEATERLLRHYGPDNATPSRLRMARIPQGANLIDNPVSAAPGFRIANVYVMAGVPAIMRGMLETVVAGLAGGAVMLQRSIACHLGESALAEPLTRIQDAHPNVEIGSYPWFKQGAYGVSLVVRGTDYAVLEGVAAEIARMIRDLGGEPVEGNKRYSANWSSAARASLGRL
jgi:molybdenum cofactor synthesis domain-containing protein